MTPEDRRRLVQLLGMLGSEFDGERAAAALAADRLRHKLGAAWDQLVAPDTAITQLAPVDEQMGLSLREQDIQDLERLEQGWVFLSPRQRDLAAGFLAYLQTHDLLTARQRVVLDDMMAKLDRRRRSA